MTTTQNNFIYRTISIHDKEELKQLGIISYGQFSNVLESQHFETLNGFLHDENKLVQLINNSTGFACVHNGKIVGMAYILASGNPWDIFKAEWSYIRMVGVNPAYGGQGIAKTLTGMCINHAIKTNEKIVALHTSEFMNAARHIYESLGFKVLQEIEPRFGK